MRKLLLAVLFLLIVSTGCSAGLSPVPVKNTVAPAPAVAQSNSAETWDFGQIKEGIVARHTFVFKNDTLKTLTIRDVNTSCGCTASQVKNKVLAAGEKTDIDVSFNSKNYSGSVEQFVFVNTDNIEKPVVKYAIKAEVIK